MEEFEEFKFKSKEDFEAFKKEYNGNWINVLMMIDPVTYGNILCNKYHIERPKYYETMILGDTEKKGE